MRSRSARRKTVSAGAGSATGLRLAARTPLLRHQIIEQYHFGLVIHVGTVSARGRVGALMTRCSDGLSAHFDDFTIQPLKLFPHLMMLQARKPAELRNIPERLPHNRGIRAVGISWADIARGNLLRLEQFGELTETQLLRLFPARQIDGVRR
jgi:hypothetical protein